MAQASHATTIETDVLDGYDACLAALREQDPRADDAEVLACSSAGGGLRIAVVGNEELVTAEAGRRVALSSGGRVVEVVAAAGRVPDDAAWRVLGHTTRPDVVLLTGGTDGGNTQVIVDAARGIVAGGWTGPVVVAGNVDARAEVEAALAGTPYVVADNVVPRIGVLAPDSARAAIRAMFLSHVIGGKHLSKRADFTAMVTGATPDVVLTGVELLARGLDESIRAWATWSSSTSAAPPPTCTPWSSSTPRRRTSPARSSPPRRSPARSRATSACAGRPPRRSRPPSSPTSSPRPRCATPTPGSCRRPTSERDEDERIAAAAVGLALRRHAGRSQVVVGPDGRVVERTGKDLREVDVLVGSGGVLRHGRPGVERTRPRRQHRGGRGRLAAARTAAGRGRPRLRARRGRTPGRPPPGGGVPPGLAAGSGRPRVT